MGNTECEAYCNNDADCKGFEIKEGTDHCEIWKKTPTNGSGGSGYKCKAKKKCWYLLKRDEDGDMTADNFVKSGIIPAASTFEKKKGGCRVAGWKDPAGHEGANYVVAKASNGDCQAQCAAIPDCKGFEVSVGGTHCELWKDKPTDGSASGNFECNIKGKSWNAPGKKKPCYKTCAKNGCKGDKQMKPGFYSSDKGCCAFWAGSCITCCPQ